MARPKKQTVDYFPHVVSGGKTLFIVEKRYGNDGYAFWFKVLELLGSTNGHIINTKNPDEWEFLLAKTLVDDSMAREILDLLAKLNAIDLELWENGIIWGVNFVDNIADVYKNRKVDLPQKPKLNDFYEYKPEQSIVSTSRNKYESQERSNTKVKKSDLQNVSSDSFYEHKPEHADVSTNINSNELEFSTQPTDINSQSKVKESKVKESKVKHHPADDSEYQNLVDLYQSNFGPITPFVSQDLQYNLNDFGYELVHEAMKRAAFNQKRYSYAVGILKDWASNNIDDIDKVNAQDLEHKQKTSGYSPNLSKVGQVPEWAKEPQKAEATQEEMDALEERFKKLEQREAE